MIHPMITDRLILREYTDADKNAYFRLKSDPKTMYYLQDIRLRSLKEAEADLSEVLNDQKSEKRKFYFFHIELKDTREQVGSIGYTVTDFTPAGKMVNAGYFIYPLRRFAHGDIGAGVIVEQPVVQILSRRRAEAVGHILQTSGNHDILLAGKNGIGSRGDGLQSRGAEAVDRLGGDALRQTRTQHDQTRNVEFRRIQRI